MEIDYDKLRRILKECGDYGKGTVLKDNESVSVDMAQDNSEGISLEKNGRVFKKFLDSDIGSESEMEAKKLMALSFIVANDDRSGEEIAATVDGGMSNAKVAYKVGNGEIDVVEAIEILIDRAAVRADAFLQYMINMDMVGEVVTTVAALVYPPIAAYKPIIKTVLKVAEPAVRTFITKGLSVVATASKKLLRNVAEKAKLVSEVLKGKATKVLEQSSMKM